MKISRLFQLFFLIIGISATINIQDTIYNYHNRTVYIHIQEDEDESVIIALPFNFNYYSGEQIESSMEPPGSNCKIETANNNLYAFCPELVESRNTTNLLISKYNVTSNNWNNLPIDSQIEFLNNSAYLNTFDDDDAIYIFSGYNETSNKLSNRMIRVDLLSYNISDAETSVQPDPFYGSSNLVINYNTEILVGGKEESTWLNLSKIPVWQYSSWAERPSTMSNSNNTINPRIQPLLLPIFDSKSMNLFYENDNFTDFSVNSVIAMGGTKFDKHVTPNFAKLDLSNNVWQWESLDQKISVANNNNNSKTSNELNLDLVLGAAIIYDTLIIITNTSGDNIYNLNDDNSKSKKKRSSNDYYIKLYNTTTFENIAEIDYTYLSDNKILATHSNKNLIIVLSVIIPILAVSLVIALLIWLYKRYKTRKDEEAKEKEIKDIVDFYQNAQKQNSESSISSYGSTKPKTSHDSSINNHSDVKINNFDDGDNLSISSWRKKRETYEKQRKHLIPHLATNKSINFIENQQNLLINQSQSTNLLRSLSNASTYLGKSIKRTLSTQSSIRTFMTARTTQPDDHEVIYDEEKSIGSIEQPQSPYIPPPNHIYSNNTPTHTNSSLYHIPENSSVTTFYSSPKTPDHNLFSTDSLLRIDEVSPSLQFSLKRPLSNSSNNNNNSNTNNNGKLNKRLSLLSNLSAGSFITNNENPFAYEEDEKQNYINNSGIDNENENNGNLDNLDVQVLVSSKRRSRLRVVNPDIESLESNISDEQRCVSSESDEGLQGLHGFEQIPRKRCISDESKNKDENL